MSCNTNDFMFPMQADVFYPKVEQGAYGNVTKAWFLDRTIVCNFTPAGSSSKEEIKPNVDLTLDSILTGRVKNDIRISASGENLAVTNVIITNIRDQNCNEIYLETAGPRVGKSTIFEIATQQPFTGAFGTTEYYSIILRRSDNQAVDV